MKLTIEINGDNSAFVYEGGLPNAEEFKAVITQIADNIEFYLGDSQKVNLRDSNGNKCGFFAIELEDNSND